MICLLKMEKVPNPKDQKTTEGKTKNEISTAVLLIGNTETILFAKFHKPMNENIVTYTFNIQ